MATWSVKPIWKKSIVERQYMHKGDNTFMVETGWRWGEFHVHTEDDTPPVLEPGVDILNCDYESEMIETEDGCWEEHDFDDCDDDTQAWLEEFLEDNSVYDLEEHGWEYGDCEMYIECDMEITKINDDGSEGEKFTTEQENTNEPVKIEQTAAWPFSTASKPEEK